MATIDLRVLAGLGLGLLAAPAARADTARCAPIVHAAGLAGPWARALAEVWRALAERDDVDHCVELVVSPEAGRVRLTMRLAAGGDATRLVDTPDDLGPTLVALLLVPARPAPVIVPEPAPAPAPGPALIEPSRVEAWSPPALRPDRVQDTVLAPAPPAAAAHLEVGIAGEARWQNALAVGVGGFADVALGRWLVGATGEWSAGLGDEAIPLPGNGSATGPATTRFATRTAVLGVELGRRFALGSLELTGLLGPRVAMISRRFQSPPPPVTVVSPFTGAATTLRFAVADSTRAAGVDGGLRARWAGSGRVQLVLGIDVSVDLAAAHDNGLAMAPGGELVAVLGPERPAWGVAFTFGGLFQVSP